MDRWLRLRIRHGATARRKGVVADAVRLLSRGRGARSVRDDPCIAYREGADRLDAEPSGPPSWRSLRGGRRTEARARWSRQKSHSQSETPPIERTHSLACASLDGSFAHGRSTFSWNGQSDAIVVERSKGSLTCQAAWTTAIRTGADAMTYSRCRDLPRERSPPEGPRPAASGRAGLGRATFLSRERA